MKAFTLKIKELFKLDTTNTSANFSADKRKLLIPLYQREFKWSDEKVTTLFNDIKKHDKFLGNIILDETSDDYQIVDGQQRITTCYMILLCLFNYYKDYPREQQALKNYIKPYGDILLQNDSVGNYLYEHDNIIEIKVSEDPAVDMYSQKHDFEHAYDILTDLVSKFATPADVADFKNNFLECELLVLINIDHTQTSPVEQLFLDINEKAQLLEVEDIFKGHCFENFDEASHSELRDLWVDLKKCSLGFKKFGFENTSQYIYLYLLETDSATIPEKLTLDGKHYLDGKTMDDTEQLLLQMIKYGENVLQFYENIRNTDYRFVDLCANSYEYRHQRDHIILKQMCSTMLEPRGNKAQYQKLPLMYLIYGLLANEELVGELTHKDFRKIITNLYIYTSIFVFNGIKKSRNDIDHCLRDAIRNADIGQMVGAAKSLRENILESFSISASSNFEKLSFICSIIDNYNSNENWLPVMYLRENGFNLEHLIIPDNRNRKVEWIDGEESFTISLPVFVKSYKKKTINYLILNETLNGEIEHDDIVTKIAKIRAWYSNRDESVPKHISFVFEYIENMREYNDLKNLKNTGASPEEIKEKYMAFINAYFDDENSSLLPAIQTLFKHSFQNN